MFFFLFFYLSVFFFFFLDFPATGNIPVGYTIPVGLQIKVSLLESAYTIHRVTSKISGTSKDCVHI